MATTGLATGADSKDSVHAVQLVEGWWRAANSTSVDADISASQASISTLVINAREEITAA